MALGEPDNPNPVSLAETTIAMPLGELAIHVFSRLSVVPSRLLGDRAHQAPAILTFHRVTPRTPGVTPSAGDVTPKQFRQQLLGLRGLGYEFVSLHELLNCHAEHRPSAPRRLVLTFDDGYECIFRHAFPILEELQAPATLFLATSYLDRSEPFPFEPWGLAHWRQAAAEVWRPLSSDQCEEMAASGLVELAAHTHTHQDFRGRPAELTEDLAQCVDFLGRRFGRRRPTFAFPWGKTSRGFAGGVLSEAARQTGVCCALSTACKPVDTSEDPFTWGRYTVCRWDTTASLEAKNRGWYSYGPQLLELATRRFTPKMRETFSL